jgi:hypothetical protein
MRLTTITVLMVVVIQYLNAQQFSWAKKMGSSGSDRSYSVLLDTSGNIYMSGYFSHTVDFDPGPGVVNLTSSGSNDVFILKLDSFANLVWVKQLDATIEGQGKPMAIDISGNIYLTGYFSDTTDFDPGVSTYNLISKGANDAFILKLSATGNFLWAKQFGGLNNDEGKSVAVDSVGNVFSIGMFSNTCDFDPGTNSYNISVTASGFYVSKVDSLGSFLWAKSFGGDGNSIIEEHSLGVDSKGNVIVTGSFNGNVDFDPGSSSYYINVSGDVFAFKLDNAGNLRWIKHWGNLNYMGASSYSSTVDNSDNLYTIGGFSDTVDFDPGLGVYNLTDGGAFVSKLDSSGNFVWARNFTRNFPGGGSITPNCLAYDALGNTYTTGYFSGVIDCDPGVNTYNISAVGQNDLFIVKLNSLGNFVWAKQMGGSWDVVGNFITIDPHSNIYTTGCFGGNADFDPAPTTYSLVSAGLYDAFVHKMGWSSGVGIADDFISSESNLFIYPNPSHGSFTATSSYEGVYSIINQLGQKVKTIQLDADNNYSVRVEGLKIGIYFVVGFNDDQITNQKLVITD